MTKIKNIVAALLCTVMLTGCGGTSDKTSNSGISEVLEDFKLSDMLSDYKMNLIHSPQDSVYEHPYNNDNRYDDGNDPTTEKYKSIPDEYYASRRYGHSQNGYPYGNTPSPPRY